MNSAHLRAYLERGWALAEDLEREHWAQVRREHGGKATWSAARMLFEQMRRLQPGWPSDEARREDLEHHLAQKRLLEAAARALSAR